MHLAMQYSLQTSEEHMQTFQGEIHTAVMMHEAQNPHSLKTIVLFNNHS